MWCGLQLVTEPASEPLALDDAKLHVRSTEADDDLHLSALLRAAREQVEADTGRQLLSATWRATFSCWSQKLLLPRPPLRTVESVEYLDYSGATQTVPTSVYRVRTDIEPGAVGLRAYQTWPTALAEEGQIKVTYTAGYDAGKVPAGLLHAMRLLLGHWHENREGAVIGTIANDIPLGYAALIAPFRILGFGA